ncbi:MAG: YqgE/AlgH family protein [Actinomycetota bacterium]
MTWAGRLLVATPGLTDDNFARTVVQLLQHDPDEGAMGVVVNRPSLTPVRDVLPGWALLAPEPVLVFVGGPVEPSSAICLAQLAPGAPERESYLAVPGAPWLGTVDLDEEAAEAVEQVRLFAGYAGWSAGQLEAEVERGDWWVFDGLPGDCFAEHPERLWSQVLKRQGLPLSLAASFPADPSLN